MLYRLQTLSNEKTQTWTRAYVSVWFHQSTPRYTGGGRMLDIV